MPPGPHCTARTAATHADGTEDLGYDYGLGRGDYDEYGYGFEHGDHSYDEYGYDEYLDLEGDAEEYGCWLVALVAVDGKSYVYRVYAPPDALRGDLFWEAWHCHDEGPHPRAYDVFDTASIRHIGNLHQE
ncbi:hypothetical protein [Streptomyces cavernicola]|uniref:Uncharacterized protein n=1 Tax=Streptomyces cavernicola TaxID=3043613 RepID=A0ABT6SI11_9ACTN|nr:hypothetical protein [Streptomyces sp. B-S-A6]MDI3407509.1 hypothetical protein [Streptomyces sp. B-S-A6]